MCLGLGGGGGARQPQAPGRPLPPVTESRGPAPRISSAPRASRSAEAPCPAAAALPAPPGPLQGQRKLLEPTIPSEGLGSFASTVTLDKDRSPVSSSVNEGLTSGVLRKDLEGRLPFAFISSLPADPILADLSAAHLPARSPPSPGSPTLREPFLAARLKARGASRSPRPSFSP